MRAHILGAFLTHLLVHMRQKKKIPLETNGPLGCSTTLFKPVDINREQVVRFYTRVYTCDSVSSISSKFTSTRCIGDSRLIQSGPAIQSLIHARNFGTGSDVDA